MFVRFFYCKNTNNLLNFSTQSPRSAKNNFQTNSAQQDIAGVPLSVGYANAHPRLSPVGLRLRVHVLSGRTCILDFCERLYPDSVLPYAPTAWLRIT